MFSGVPFSLKLCTLLKKFRALEASDFKHFLKEFVKPSFNSSRLRMIFDNSSSIGELRLL